MASKPNLYRPLRLLDIDGRERSVNPTDVEAVEPAPIGLGVAIVRMKRGSAPIEVEGTPCDVTMAWEAALAGRPPVPGIEWGADAPVEPQFINGG